LPYLAAKFDRVFIFPIYNPTGSLERREVPANVAVLSPILKQGVRRFLEGLLQMTINTHYRKDFFKEKVYRSPFKLKMWVNSLFLYNNGVLRINNLLKSQRLTNSDTIIYAYWARAPFFLSRRLHKLKKVLRMHGGDFYIERNRGYLPAQKYIYDSSEVLLPISKDIAERLEKLYQQPKEKIRVSYLGVGNAEVTCAWAPFTENLNKIRFVSCSNIIPLKRIHLIYEILRNIRGIDVEWFHIGDGPTKEALIAKFHQEECSNLKWNFVGQLNQNDLRAFYRENYFDWFINVSEYEGLPVSIMEAFSFGIPVIATDVGGTSEIVNNKNGILVQKDFDAKVVASLILSSRKKKPYLRKRVCAFETWYDFFNAERNYSLLASYLKCKI